MFKPLTCPRCSAHIPRCWFGDWECPHCHADLGLAQSYERVLALLTLASVCLIAVATHKSTSGGEWLLKVFLSAIPCWLIFRVVVPPWLKQGRNQDRLTFVKAWLGAAITVFLVGFVLFGAAHVLLGASRREFQEFLEMLSLPLAWISPNSLITPGKGLLHVYGVILGNSVFFGALIYVCYQPVRWAFRRWRPTQLSLSDGDSTEDNE